MKRVRNLVVRAGLVVGLMAVPLLPMASPAAAAIEYSTDLSADQVVPGPGDSSAEGTATFSFDADEGQACTFIEFQEPLAPTAVAIGEGDLGEAGSAVVSFDVTGDADEFYVDCSDADPSLVAAIIANPSGYFLQVSTEGSPDGAVRGQIEAFDAGINISFTKFACPGKVRSIDDLDPVTFAPCVNAARIGDIEPAPPGFQYDPKPILFDLEATVTDASGSRTLDEAELDGGGFCDPATMTCTIVRGYLWFGVAAGGVTVRELTAPTGYRFGGAIVSVDGQTIPAEVDAPTAAVSFNGPDAGGTVSVIVFDFRGPVR